MRVVIGIGNPGLKYHLTRHNIGFTLIDTIIEQYKLKTIKNSKNYISAGGSIGASHFFLVKPNTYVNLTGLAAAEILSTSGIAISDLLVLVDDLNLEIGQIRIRKSGGDGGHNGLKSIIKSLNSSAFPRLRFGIGNDFETGRMADFVLDKFDEKDSKILNDTISMSTRLIEQFILGGVDLMLNEYSKIRKSEISTGIKEDNGI